MDGDCVVPKDWALLEGANQIVLDGVFHSMSKVSPPVEPTTTGIDFESQGIMAVDKPCGIITC